MNVTEFILWVIILGTNGSPPSQAAALFPSAMACDNARVQMLKAIAAPNLIPSRRVVAECLPLSSEK